jgi:hypothetical protein
MDRNKGTESGQESGEEEVQPIERLQARHMRRGDLRFE